MADKCDLCLLGLIFLSSLLTGKEMSFLYKTFSLISFKSGHVILVMFLHNDNLI